MNCKVVFCKCCVDFADEFRKIPTQITIGINVPNNILAKQAFFICKGQKTQLFKKVFFKRWYISELRFSVFRIFVIRNVV